MFWSSILGRTNGAHGLEKTWSLMFISWSDGDDDDDDGDDDDDDDDDDDNDDDDDASDISLT